WHACRNSGASDMDPASAGQAPAAAGTDPGDRIRLAPSWKARVGDYLRRPEMQPPPALLRQRRAAGARIYPAPRHTLPAVDRIRLEPSWKARVGDYLRRPEMQQLAAFLRQRRAAGARIYPAARNIFAAFDATPFDAVKVVILGQDPYHGPGQAHGLCFSVQPGTAV